MGGTVPGIVTPARLVPALSRMCTATLAVVELPLKTNKLVWMLFVGDPGKNAGVHAQTKGGPPADAPGGPCGPWGPCGPVMFHSTNVSFAWQAALESTSRIIPLPGLIQASSMPEEVAASRVAGISKISTATATKARQARPARRRDTVFISISSLGHKPLEIR